MVVGPIRNMYETLIPASIFITTQFVSGGLGFVIAHLAYIDRLKFRSFRYLFAK